MKNTLCGKKIVIGASGGASNKRSYPAFVARNPFMKGRVNVHLFFDCMGKNGIMFPDRCVANFERGNELWYGKGTVRINKYRVNVE